GARAVRRKISAWRGKRVAERIPLPSRSDQRQAAFSNYHPSAGGYDVCLAVETACPVAGNLPANNAGMGARGFDRVGVFVCQGAARTELYDYATGTSGAKNLRVAVARAGRKK